MARALARGASSSPSNPVLDLWTLAAGALADVYALGFQIYDVTTGTPTQVYPGSGVQAVNVSGSDHLGTGHYSASWTVGGSENLGLHRIVWSVTPTNGAAIILYQADFDVLAAGLSLKGPAYCLLSSLRAEGFTASVVTDARALGLILRASMQIEKWTKRFFEPRYRTFTIDGSEGRSLFLSNPIIAVTSVTADGSLVEPADYQAFNRHIAEGLTNPDDRDNPRITFKSTTRVLADTTLDPRAYSGRQLFWPGPRNIQVVGLFGYTEPDVDVQAGATPKLLELATMLLVQRSVPLVADGDTTFEVQNASRVKSIRTRDQSIDYGPGRSDLVSRGAGGEFTGDPAIDDIIADFIAPPFIGSP